MYSAMHPPQASRRNVNSLASGCWRVRVRADIIRSRCGGRPVGEGGDAVASGVLDQNRDEVADGPIEVGVLETDGGFDDGVVDGGEAFREAGVHLGDRLGLLLRRAMGRVGGDLRARRGRGTGPDVGLGSTFIGAVREVGGEVHDVLDP